MLAVVQDADILLEEGVCRNHCVHQQNALVTAIMELLSEREGEFGNENLRETDRSAAATLARSTSGLSDFVRPVTPTQ